MSEVVVVSAPAPAAQMQESGLDRVIRYFVILVVIALVVAVGVALYYFVENWEWLATTVTSGFLGFLNPFDDPADDTVLGVSTDPNTNPAGGMLGTIISPLGGALNLFSRR